MERLSRREQWCALVLGLGGSAGLLALQQPWRGHPRSGWAWSGFVAAWLLVVAGGLARRGLAVLASFLVALAPWDFWYPAAVPFLVLAIVLLVRRNGARS